ncbi:MAG: S1C family serine protease, partial [Pirellulales bacterium]|nr:S1C family serine protease [Pirellulales bacterium]
MLKNVFAALLGLAVAGPLATAQTAVDLQEAAKAAMPATIAIKLDSSANPSGQQLGYYWMNAGSERPRSLILAERPQPGQPLLRTGFVVDSGLAVTSHLPPKAEQLEVVTSDGKRVSGKVAARDHVTGLALLRLEAAEVPAVLKVYQGDVPAGAPVAVTWLRDGKHIAIDSATMASPSQSSNPSVGFTQQIDTDLTLVAIGAPVVNTGGQLVGVIGMSDDGQILCLPSLHVARLVASLDQSDGDLKRGRIGIQLNQDGAPLVTRVMPESPGLEAGIEAGDQILSVGEIPTQSQSDVLAAVAMARAGDELAVVVRRGEEEIRKTLKLGVVPVQKSRIAWKPQPQLPGIEHRAFKLEGGRLVPLEGQPPTPPKVIQPRQPLVVPPQFSPPKR